MKEKTLITYERPSIKIFIIIMAVIAVLLAVAVFIPIFSSVSSSVETAPAPTAAQMSIYNRHRGNVSCGFGFNYYERCNICRLVEEYQDTPQPSPAFEGFKAAIGPALISFAVIMGIALLFKLFMTSFSLDITDKGVYCTTLWVHTVCIPIDSITSVTRVGLLNILSIGAPAARITVLFLPDSKAFYYILNKLLVERQEEALTPATNTDTTAV